MAETKQPKLAIFDLGNVVFGINWEPMYESWSRDCGVAVEALKSLGQNCQAELELFERNALSDREFHQAVNALLGVDLSFEQFAKGWNAIFEEAHGEVCDLLPHLGQRMQVVAYSNTNEIHAPVWSERYAGVLGHFDAIFRSSQIGIRKPDPLGFLHVLEQRGVAPEESLFFDDLPANVEAARRLGMTAVLVDEPARVRESLERLGLL